jgi:hypothetical protein
LFTETVAAGLFYGRQLFFGAGDNVGDRFADVASDLGIAITVPAI